MFFGKGGVRNAADTNIQPQTGFIFDVSVAEFEEKVLKASMERPIIVDFWATWCGPCKQLGPLLEKAVNAAGGKVLMAKVDIDRNQELAAALRIQSVPTVYAFFQGRPLDGFQGAMPESQIKAFVDKIVQAAQQTMPGALDIAEALKAAAQALADGDTETAQAVYSQILEQDENNVAAYIGLVRALIASGQLDQASALVEHAPEKIAKDSSFAQARTALELAQARPAAGLQDLALKLEGNPDDHQARFDLAGAQFSDGRKEEAIESLLEIVRRNRNWNEDQARKQLLKFFDALGPADPLTVAGRKKLSSILFS
jgi:putative thioredoxin